MNKALAVSFLCPLFTAPAWAANRPPAVAGQFYPADSKELSRVVDEYLAQAPAPAKLPGPLVALIVPHAGYEFSAPVAAVGYKEISGSYDIVAILGTAHHKSVATAALYAKGAFDTPLGPVRVDENLAARLLKEPGLFADDPQVHEREHSIEVQLPFLIKRLKPGFKLLPIVMNTGDPRICEAVGRTLAKALKGRKALIIASSDLSHYPPADVADKLDRTTLKALERLDPGFFWLANRIMMAHAEPGEEVAWCGEAAVIAVMAAAKEMGADRAVVLRYANSGSAPHGEAGRTVGYAAVAMVRSGKPPASGIVLDAGEKKALLELARRTVADGAEARQSKPELSADPALNLPAAVFVTLTEGGQLRGCVGTTEARGTLRDAVAFAAYSAAFEDHRFPPVSKEEVAKLRFEISMLSPAKPVANAESVVPRKHGVIVSQGGSMGLFLPQVWEQIPEKEGFLSELCSQKAGLPRDCWKNPQTHLSVFTVGAFKD